MPALYIKECGTRPYMKFDMTWLEEFCFDVLSSRWRALSTSLYLCQRWSKSMSPGGVTKPKWLYISESAELCRVKIDASGPKAVSRILAGDINNVEGLATDVNTSIVKCGMKLLIHSRNSTLAPLTFGNGIVISPTLYWTGDYISTLRLKLIHVGKTHHKQWWAN